MLSIRLSLVCALHVVVTCALLLWFAQVAMPYTFFVADAPATVPSASLSQPLSWTTVPVVPRASDLHGGTETQQPTTTARWLRFARSAHDADETNQAALLRCAAFHLALGLVTYIVTQYVIIPPYGRHAVLSPLHVTIPARLAWMLQESPTLMNVAYFVLIEYPAHAAAGANTGSQTIRYGGHVWAAVQHCRLTLMLFVIHYVHRSFLYPLAISKEANRVPVHVVWSATIYCLFNGRLQLLANLKLFAGFFGDTEVASSNSFQYVNCFLDGNAICHLGDASTSAAFTTRLLLFVSTGLCGALFLAGSYAFFYGFKMNTDADYTLLSLRARRLKRDDDNDGASGITVQQSASRYVIPHGGLFDRVCCPNFFGEIVEWFGYACAVACTSAFPHATSCWCDVRALAWDGRWMPPAQLAPALAALSFPVYVLANLVPRAVAHHAWYARTFGEAYTSLNRRALIPGVF